MIGEPASHSYTIQKHAPTDFDNGNLAPVDAAAQRAVGHIQLARGVGDTHEPRERAVTAFVTTGGTEPSWSILRSHGAQDRTGRPIRHEIK